MSCRGCQERSQAIRAAFRGIFARKTGSLREQIVTEAREWLGTPFVHQGYLKGIGCDCIGLVAGVALALGIEGAREWKDCAECHQYGRPPNTRFLVETSDRFLRRLTSPPKLADILVMSFEKEPMHFAIVSGLEPLSVVHALFGAGKTVEHRMDGVWNSRVRMFYGYRGID